MKIVFYKTFLCPRCFLTGRALARLCATRPDLEVEIVEVTRNPLRAWQDGVRLLPAVRRGNELLSGFLLSEQDLRLFLDS